MQMPAAFEVRRAIQAEASRERPRRQLSARARAPRRVPHVELAFVAFRVRVERRPVAACGRLHVAHDPVCGFGRDAAEQLFAGRERRVRVDAQQLAVVVQHLFEVRNHPVLIDGVAREAAAELIVDAAFGHALSASASPCTANAGRARRWPPSRAIGAAGTRCWSDAETSARRRSRRTAHRIPRRASRARAASGASVSGASAAAAGGEHLSERLLQRFALLSRCRRDACDRTRSTRRSRSVNAGSP